MCKLFKHRHYDVCSPSNEKDERNKFMKTAVVYYSLEENTDYVAREIAKEMHADLIRLIPKKAYATKGFQKYFWGGKSVMFGEKPELEPYEFLEESYDTIIVGFPIWASSFAPPMKTFLSEHSFRNKKLAAFSCSMGGSAAKAFDNVKKQTQVLQLVATLSLIEPGKNKSEENLKQIKEFCEQINASV